MDGCFSLFSTVERGEMIATFPPPYRVVGGNGVGPNHSSVAVLERNSASSHQDQVCLLPLDVQAHGDRFAKKYSDGACTRPVFQVLYPRVSEFRWGPGTTQNLAKT